MAWCVIGIVATLVVLCSGTARADETPPFVYDTALFETPAVVKFVQRTPNLKEWQISHSRSNMRTAQFIFQEASGGQAFQDRMSIEGLFQLLYEEEFTSDADQDPRPTLGDEGSIEFIGGTLKFAAARALDENFDIGQAMATGRASRGPEWRECVLFIWYSDDNRRVLGGESCQRTPPESELMSAGAALQEFEKLNVQFAD